MTAPKPWIPLATELLQDCAVFRVSRVSSRSPLDGRVAPFFRIDSADWVNVVPVTESGEVVMVRQYRHGADRVTLEIPGGMVDAGEGPTRAAARELLEETGYRARELRSLGGVNPNPALFGNRLHVFEARGVEAVAPVRNEGHEHTVVQLVARHELPALVCEGRIDHALVLAALHLWALKPEPPPRGLA